MTRMRCTALALAAGVALGLGLGFGPAAPTADAQMRMSMGRGPWGMGDRISATDIEQFTKILSLTKAQQDAMKDLHQAYQSGVEDASKAFQAVTDRIRQEWQDSQDPSVWQKDMPEAAEKFQKKTDELEKSFMGDLKALLTPEQEAHWPSLERAHRRNTSLTGMAIPGFGLAGESVDLVKLVEDLKLAKTPEPLRQSLDRYESEMDQALIERDKKRKDIEEQGKSLMPGGRGGGGGGGMPDFQKIQDLMSEVRKSGLKVRDVNDRYAPVLASAMPDDKKDAFEVAYRKAKFPAIYREPYPLKALNAAKDFKDLDAEQKSGIQELTTKYQREVGSANEVWAKAQTDAEKDGGGDDMMSGMMRMWGGDQGGEETPLAKARKVRRDLDRDTIDKLKGLLNEDQVSRLPERDNDGMFQFGGPRRR